MRVLEKKNKQKIEKIHTGKCITDVVKIFEKLWKLSFDLQSIHSKFVGFFQPLISL